MPERPIFGDLFDRVQVAQELGISERTLRKLLAQHPIPVLRVRRRMLFDDGSIRALREAFAID